MIFSRPVNPRASRTADIVASVPLDTRRTMSSPEINSVSNSAISTSRRDGAPKLVAMSAWLWIASMTRGWPCPRMNGPHEPT